MALRVLLADESTTIKKVMQLALQDFAVEVKAVHVGVDVVEVARAFQPDIVFADVLLQKRNGYEVCGDLKKDPQTRELPVVLMWSSFMELDENLASACSANQRLEKPFDVEHLRRIVLELVPKTRSQRLAHFLQFPGSFAEPLKEEERQRASSSHSAPQAMAPASSPQPLQPRSQVQPQRQPQNPAQNQTQNQTQRPAQQPPQSRSQPQSQPQSESQSPDETASNWNMESFEDIQEFATRTEMPPNQSSRPSSGTRSHVSGAHLRSTSDEEFSEFKIASIAERSKSQVDHSAPQAEDQSFSLEDDQESSDGGFVLNDEPTRPRVQAGDDDEAWSHQDLSRFKVDLEPVSLETEDETYDLSRNRAQQPQRPSPAQRPSSNDDQKNAGRNPQRSAQTSPSSSQPSLHSPADDEFNDLLEIDEAPMRLDSTDEPTTLFGEAGGLELDPTFSGEDLESAESIDDADNFRHSNTSSGSKQKPIRASIPELSSDELERIVRAQSRETIEALVRKIVPDLAARIIREELERLLEENP